MRYDTTICQQLPPLTPEEYSMLSTDCIKRGILEPLTIWIRDKTRYILDGYHRYKIAQEHNLKFKTTQVELKNEHDALLWAFCNQLSRRNLSRQRYLYMLGKLYLIYRGDKTQGQRQGDNRGTTADMMSKKYHIPKSTINGAGQYAAALDILVKIVPEILPAALDAFNVRLGLSQGNVMALSKLSTSRARMCVKQMLAYKSKKHKAKKISNILNDAPEMSIEQIRDEFNAIEADLCGNDSDTDFDDDLFYVALPDEHHDLIIKKRNLNVLQNAPDQSIQNLRIDIYELTKEQVQNIARILKLDGRAHILLPQELRQKIRELKEDHKKQIKILNKENRVLEGRLLRYDKST